MDKCEVVKNVLTGNKKIVLTTIVEEYVFFKIKNKRFVIYSANEPSVFVYKDDLIDFPHVMIYMPPSKELKDYYNICLYENNSKVDYFMTFEDKITDVINRLFNLLSLSGLQKEQEYQKEFLYYWNRTSVNRELIELFIGYEKIFQRMNCYKSKDENRLRFVKQNDIDLNDLKNTKNEKNWEFIILPAFYIPITDNRRILPPLQSKPWDAEDILKIITGKNYQRISSDTYDKISRIKIKSKRVVLIFGMMINGNEIDFLTLINFSNQKSKTLLNKLKNDISFVQPYWSKRMDFYFLNKQIGNDVSIIDKKVTIVGAGSLGSYLAKELIRSGICNLTIYDSDNLEPDNTFRYGLDFCYYNYKKVQLIKNELERFHPQIHITAIDKEMDEQLLKKETQNCDLIIFTVGCSDIQLRLNQCLEDEKYNKPVLFVWLEAGGVSSHILKVNYTANGCYQCLFTNKHGTSITSIDNKANKSTDEEVINSTIHNGCGGTRVAYGTTTLLRTTGIVLETVKKIFNGNDASNNLIDITPDHVIYNGNKFAERNCKCCGY